tara:strand:+ start:95 stop:673 length:579 start_codon:yes stop_codon:yes gene_type:complete
MSNIFFNNLKEFTTLSSLISNFDKKVASASEMIVKTLKKDSTLFFCGNGGSAADSQHLVGEYISNFTLKNRAPIKAMCLTSNVSNITAIANDITYDDIFIRQITPFLDKNSTVIVLSTSGNSKNIIKLVKFLSKKNINVISFTKNSSNLTKKYSDINFSIPSKRTDRTQEIYLFLNHTICEIVEKKLFLRNP